MNQKKRFLKTISLLLLLYIVTINIFGLSQNTGKEFYVAFNKNNQNANITYTYSTAYQKYIYNVELLLRITTITQSEINLHFAANPLLDTTFTVPAGTIYDFHLNLARAQASYSGDNTLQSMRSIRVKASTPINLVAVSSADRSAEATIVFPVENLGKNYIHVGMSPYTYNNATNCNGYTIIATQDNTIVTLTTDGTFPVGPITLNKGGVYAYNYISTYQNAHNPIRTKINADKPVAYFQSNTQGAVYLSNNTQSWNFMFEQIPPVEQWGTQFIMPTNEHDGGMVRVYGHIYPTKVNILYSNGQSYTETLTNSNSTSGAYRDIKIDASNSKLLNEKAVYITSDNPISVCFYHLSRIGGLQIPQTSQPGVAWLPPIEQRTESVFLSPLDISSTHVFTPMDHYMAIIVPHASRAKTTISINGGAPQTLPETFWKATNIGGSGYSFGRYEFGQSYTAGKPPIYLNKNAVVENPDGVMVLGWGQGSYTNYFYTPGTGARNLTLKYSISGTVSGLPNNANIPVYFTINGGNQQVTNTAPDGNYTIPNVPAGSNVIITGSLQPGYVSTVSDLPSTSIVESNIIGKNIIYKVNNTIVVEYTKVFNCHQDSEIDVLALMGHHDSHGSYTFEMLEQPKYADSITGLNSRQHLPYNPHINFQGEDKLKFTFSCDSKPGKLDTVKLFVFSVNCPDNIVSTSCSDTSKKHIWDLRLRSKTRIGSSPNYSDYVNAMDVPLVGDIYGTGEIKILAAVARDPGLNATGWFSEGIAIFDGKTGAFEKTITTLPFHTGSGTRAIAKINDRTKIFIATGSLNNHSTDDNRLVCYDLETGNLEWTSDASYTPEPHNITANILVADMNADGTPEVIAGNKIFNAETGKLLLDMSSISGFTFGLGAGYKFQSDDACEHLPYFPAVADMANDGVLEFVAGYNIYKIFIPANANDTNGSKIYLHKTVKPAPDGNLNNVGDGATAIADLDGDGYLDVIVTRYSGTAGGHGYPYLYAWSGKTGQMFGNALNICQNYLSGDTVSHYGQGPSIPVIGDIDGCGIPEICVSTSHGIHAFKYNSTSKKLEEIAKYVTNNKSGSVAMTMFDFDQCGKQELLFHDLDRGHILSLQGNTFVDLVANSYQLNYCFTHTQNEYPVVADVTGNGRANIIIFGSEDKVTDDTKFGKGFVYIFEGTPEHPWAPAREVWNQWAYNAVNVNNDLTIPKYQANPAIMYLSGECGKVHPYNGFLQQQTLLDNDGCFVWSLPNLQWTGNSSHIIAGDSMVISGKVTNMGNIGMPAPIYVTIYKESVKDENIIKLDSIHSDLHAGETVKFSFTIKNISNLKPLTKLIVNINDKNGIYPHQEVCENIITKEFALDFSYKIWNWADLAYINVLIDNEKKNKSPRLSDYSKFMLMQDLGVPEQNNYGTGIATDKNGNIACHYFPEERKNGWYGYQNFTDSNPAAFDSETIYSNILEVGGTTTAADTILTNALPWNTGGWEPIGNWTNTLTTKPFVGIFDGQGFEINGLWINRTDKYAPVQGLFAYVKHATIQNLGVHFPDSIISSTGAAGLAGMVDTTTIANCYTTGTIKIAGSGNAGGLVSRFTSGIINNSYSSCDLINNNTNNSNNYGGLVALAIDQLKISNSYATGNISYAKQGGGLVGSLYNNLINPLNPHPDDHINASLITNCFTTVNVTGFDVGGLVGDGMGIKIINSYATGDVTGSNYAGGISGIFYANGSEIKNCYATGSVTGRDYVGGIVGYGMYDGIISNSFALNRIITATSLGTNVGRVVGKKHLGVNNPTALSNNHAFECMLIWKNGVQQDTLSLPPAHNNEHGADIELSQVTTDSAYTTSPNSWDFTNTWIHSPYSTNYKTLTGDKETNLPILRVFDINANKGFFAHAEQPSHAECMIVEIVYYADLVWGTVFPFFFYGNQEFDNLFPVTASLYDISLLPLGPEPILAAKPIYTTTAVYYDGTEFVSDTPKFPGFLGCTYNPGAPINWSVLNVTPAEIDNTPLQIGEKPKTQIGLYKFPKVKQGEYILVLKKEGYFPRFAKVNIDKGEVQMEHRELIPGYFIENKQVNESILEKLITKISYHSNPVYHPAFDLNGDLKIDATDLSILKVYMGFGLELYEDTLECFPQLQINE